MTPHYRATVGIFFPEETGSQKLQDLHEGGAGWCYLLGLTHSMSWLWTTTWSLLWGKQCRRPYFGVNLHLDRNSNERCGNSGTHKEMALVSSLQGSLRTTDLEWQHWRDEGKMEWTRCRVTGTNTNIFQKSSKLLKNKILNLESWCYSNF